MSASSNNFLRFVRASLAAIIAVSCFIAGSAAAQEYPTRTIKMIVHQPPGGSTDASARMVAADMSATLKQTIIVENRPGAGGNIGVEAIVRSPPDGYTIGILSTGPGVVNRVLGPPPPFKADDYVFIGAVNAVEFVLVARKDLPANSVKELIEYAKANPGALRHAEAGGPARLGLELFKSMTGTDITRVPYKGDADALNDLAGGHVDFGFLTVAGSHPLIQAGSIKALAVPFSTRSKVIPTVPTVSESGLPGFEISAKAFLIAPKGTPEPIIQKLNEALNAALKRPSTVEKYTALGLSSAQQTPAQAAADVQKELAIAAKIVKDANIEIQK